MGFDGGSGFVPGNTGGGPPPGPNDILVGKTLFVSDAGLGGAYEDLTYHYNDINDAIQALTSNKDVIHVYGGNWAINAQLLPVQTLNIMLFNQSTKIEFLGLVESMENLNISGNGFVVFNTIQDYLTSCHITASILHTGPLLQNVSANFYFDISDTLITAFLLNGKDQNIYIKANKIVANLNATNPEDICDIICNEFYGLFYVNIGVNHDWRFSLKANKIYYIDPTSSATAMFNLISTLEDSQISKFIIQCPNIYWYSLSKLILQDGGCFGFKNCTFTHELPVSEEVPSIFVQKTSINANKTIFYFKNCDHNFILSDINYGVIELNSPGNELISYIENCNFYAEGGNYSDPTFVILSSQIRDYYGISGNADQNVFDDFASPLLTNIAGSPNVQLINYLPKL